MVGTHCVACYKKNAEIVRSWICDLIITTSHIVILFFFVILCYPNQNTNIDSRLNSQTVKTQVCHCCSFHCCASQWKLTLCACRVKLKVTRISGLFLALWLQRASFLRRISSPNVRVERRSSRFSAYCLQYSTACRCTVACLLWAPIGHEWLGHISQMCGLFICIKRF